MTSGSSTVTVMETLNCRYAGRRVTYCLQFSTDECQSNTAMESTPQCMCAMLKRHHAIVSLYSSAKFVVMSSIHILNIRQYQSKGGR